MKIKILVMLFVLSLTNNVYAGGKTAAMKQADLIKYRQSAMMFLRWNMGKIKKQVIKKPEKYNREDVMAAAKVIAAIANSNMGKLFPDATKEGKGWKNTRVKSEYFYNQADVKEKYFKLVEESKSLEQIASDGDVSAIRAQFKSVLSSCKSCHKAYRQKI